MKEAEEKVVKKEKDSSESFDKKDKWIMILSKMRTNWDVQTKFAETFAVFDDAFDCSHYFSFKSFFVCAQKQLEKSVSFEETDVFNENDVFEFLRVFSFVLSDEDQKMFEVKSLVDDDTLDLSNCQNEIFFLVSQFVMNFNLVASSKMSFQTSIQLFELIDAFARETLIWNRVTFNVFSDVISRKYFSICLTLLLDFSAIFSSYLSEIRELTEVMTKIEFYIENDAFVSKWVLIKSCMKASIKQTTVQYFKIKILREFTDARIAQLSLKRELLWFLLNDRLLLKAVNLFHKQNAALMFFWNEMISISCA